MGIYLSLDDVLLWYRSVFLNCWAVDNFQRASNLVILLSFATKLYKFIIIQH